MSDSAQLIINELAKIGIDASNNRKVFLKSEEAFVISGSLSSLDLSIPFEAFLGGFRVYELLDTLSVNHRTEDVGSRPEAVASGVNQVVEIKEGIGFDVVNIEYSTIPRTAEPSAHPALKAMFSPKELLLASTTADPHATLCGYFACKEAIFKSGVTNKPIPEIFLEFDANSVPHFGGRKIALSHDSKASTVYALYPGYKLRLPSQSAGVERSVNIFIHSDSTAQRRGAQDASFEITFPQKIGYFIRDFSGGKISPVILDRSTGGASMYEGVRRATNDLGYISSAARNVDNLVIFVLGEVDAGRLALKPLSPKSYILFFKEFFQLGLLSLRTPRFLKLLDGKGVKLIVIPISTRSTSNASVRLKRFIMDMQTRLFGKFLQSSIDRMGSSTANHSLLFDETGHLSDSGHDALGRYLAKCYLGQQNERN